MRRILHPATLTGVALLAILAVAFQYETGSIEGTVKNQRGIVADASIEARNIMTGAVARARSDSAGHYEVAKLPEGRYSLRVQTATGDEMWIPKIVVERGRATHQDVYLSGPLSSNTSTKKEPRS